MLLKNMKKNIAEFFHYYKTIIFFFLLFFLSRLFFINASGVFFDSQEYFHLFLNSNYLLAIANGHFPPHEGYILLFWPLFQVVTYMHSNGAYTVILGQIVLSFFTLYFFYEFVNYISDKQIAIIATIIVSLIPLFWIINVTLMMENAYAFFFFASMYFLIKFIKSKNIIYLLHISLLLFVLSFLTNMMTVLWFPLFLYLIYIKKKNALKKVLLLFIFYISIAAILNIFFIASVTNAQPLVVAFYLYLSKRPEFPILHFDIHSLLVVLRNFLIPLLRNNTILIVILSFIALLVGFKKEKKFFILGVLFIIPAIYTNQWWDSLLNGRHALLTGFGMAILVAYLLKNKYWAFIFVTIYLLFVSMPVLFLLREPIPYLVEAQYVATLPKNALLIESHFARPQVQETVKAKTIYVNEPTLDIEPLTKKIDRYLRNKKPVFVSSTALSEPYGLYSGPYLHNITLSYEKPFELESVMTNFTLKPYKTLNLKDNLLIYKLVSTKKSPYPSVMNLRNSYRRLDYYDPFWRLTWLFETTFLHR